MRRIADLYPGNAKTDQRDAFIIAQAARTMPHTLRTLRQVDEDEAELSMLTGFDDDLTRQITQTVTVTGNKHLKPASFLSPFASLRSDPTHRHYYDRKRLQGKRHNQAPIALAHRRTTVIYAMLRDHTTYQPQLIKQAA